MPPSEFSSDSPCEGDVLVPFDATQSDHRTARPPAGASTVLPGTTESPAPEFHIVVICLPCPGAGQGKGVGRERPRRPSRVDFVEVARALAEHLTAQGGPGQVSAGFEPPFVASHGAKAGELVLAGPPAGNGHDRSLLTLMFTDIVRSTGMVEQLGDGPWCALLAQHNAIVRAQLAAFDGREVDHAGDGFFATFDGPTRAVRCAVCIRGELRALGIVIRAAIHTAECETSGELVSGVAVHVAARMVSVAKPGEIVVSNTVRDLVAGSGLAFSDGERRTLRGLTGSRQLFALMPSLAPSPSNELATRRDG